MKTEHRQLDAACYVVCHAPRYTEYLHNRLAQTALSK